MSNLNECLQQLMTIDGAMLAALVDSNSGMSMGHVGQGVDIDIATAGNTEVVRAKLKTIKALNLNDDIDDILISLHKQYHIIRPVAAAPGLFFYIVLDRAKANLAMARHKVQSVEASLTL